MLKLNKQQLDFIATVLGVIGGIATVLGTNQVIDGKIAGSVSGVSLVLLGAVTQRPATAKPTTEELEEKESL